MAKTKKGYTLIEANTSPGTIKTNPYLSRKAYRYITGKWGKDIAIIGSLSTGGLAQLGMNRNKK